MALITRKEAAEQMGVTIQAVYMAIKQGRLTAITDNQGKTVINSDTMHQELTGKSAFRKMKNIQAATIDPPVTKRKISKTSELIPLCHPLPIDHTATKIIMDEKDNSLEVFCVVSAYAKTGVEMEAIMGVNAALISIYDLSKIVNPHLEINNIKLLIKEGGKSGLWKNPDGLPDFLNDIF